MAGNSCNYELLFWLCHDTQKKLINSDERRHAMKAPFPYFGGKGQVVKDVWARLGYCKNYIEPFFGSGAMLLGRPIEINKIYAETVSDKDGYLSNFWRAVKHDPNGVAEHADWPVNERDIESRHYWLVTKGAEKLKDLMGHPDGEESYDAKIAGWWLHGMCAWIGVGYCDEKRKTGWLWNGSEWLMQSDEVGINRPIPSIGHAGKGINRIIAGKCITRGDYIHSILKEISGRLRDVRVCQGDWKRITGRSVMYGALSKQDFCGIFLDPPYGVKANRTSNIYNDDCLDVAEECRLWAIEQGKNPQARIALCGYEGEHDIPEDWTILRWKANGGYQSNSKNKDSKSVKNRQRECIWFSPACIKVEGQRVARPDSIESKEAIEIPESYELFEESSCA